MWRNGEEVDASEIGEGFRVLHGATANFSAERRRVISMRWVGDDARFVERPGKTSPYFPDLTYRDGDPFEGEQFPVVYSAG